MNNNYLNFESGEITIYCGENARTNCTESLKQASALSHKTKAKTLYINTFLTTRKMMAASREEGIATRNNITYMNIEIGALAKSIWRMNEIIKEQKITCVIINSWEFAHRSYTYKESAIFDLMSLINDTNISLLVYSQAKTAKPGKIQRGGLGKLSAIASAILSLAPEPEIAAELPAKIIQPQMRNEKLDALKINELDYARSSSGISSGGELVLPDETMILEEELMAV